VSGLVLDASLALQWFFEDETDRKYSLAVLASLSQRRALVPLLWFYEVGNGLIVAHRRKRISIQQIHAFLTRLRTLPIDSAPQSPADILELPDFALSLGLTNYDAAYLNLANRHHLPLATNDSALRRAAASVGVTLANA